LVDNAVSIVYNYSMVEMIQWNRKWKADGKHTFFDVAIEADTETIAELLQKENVRAKSFTYKAMKKPVPVELDGRPYKILAMKRSK